jgi:DNA-binding FrmR family transcriptional regulator
MDKISPTKKDVLRRLKIAHGHLAKIITMIEEDSYCINVLQQTSAVRSAVKKAEEILLQNHLNSCLVKAIKQDREKEAIREVVEVFKRSA